MAEKSVKSCLLCGVGGQGTVLASRIIAAAAMEKGLHAKTAETIGMAQRGGSVVSHVRTGMVIPSPMIPKGKADILIGFEPGEATANMEYLKDGGTLILCSQELKPITASLGQSDYDGQRSIAYLKEKIDKQIVITSDVAPKNLPGIEERLISRFEGGMLQEIESPGYETRLAILKKKSEGMVPEVSDSTLKFIASNIKSHVRAMEGALGKVNLFANRDNSMQLTDDTLSYILKDFIEKEKSRKKLTIEEVQNCICKKYGVTLSQILSPERTQSIVTPRQLAMYISRKFTTRSLPEIAKKFDKSHATISHGVKNISKRLDVEPELKESLEEILADLGCSMKDMVG